MKKSFTLLALILSAALAFGQQVSSYKVGGSYYAPAYNSYSFKATSAVAATTATMTLTQNGIVDANAPCSVDTKGFGAKKFFPLFVGNQLIIQDANSETVTVTAVNNSLGGCSFTAVFANAHNPGARIISGTFGLDEAIEDAFLHGGGVVVIDPAWTAAGGTAAIANGALPFPSVSLEDDTQGAPQYWNSMPSTTSLLAAPTALTAQAACDSTHTFCSDASVAGSASWGGTVHGCITLVDINGNESPCSADASFTSVASKAIDIGAPASRSDNVVGWKPYLSVSGGSYVLSYSLPLLTQPTVLLAVPVSSGVCTLTTLETVTPACAIANTLYGQSASATGAAGLFSKGGAQFTGYPVVTNTLAPEIGSASALQHNPNEEAHATYAYVPGNRVGAPGIQSAHLVFPITAAAQTTIGEVEASIPLPANFMNYVGRTIEVCGLIAKTSTTADTVDKIQIWWDAEGSNVTAGTPVQLSSINITEAVALAAAANFHFCQQLTTTVASTSATGGSIQPGLGWASVSQVSAGANPSGGSSSLVAAVGSLNLALPAHLSVELVHTTGTDGAGSTLQGATVRVIN